MSSIAYELKRPAFVPAGSIVREIWGSTDITLFIFAGAAAEFALNREADWLYFTGQLPGDPIGRLFSTVRYARQIIFNDHAHAMHSIGRINAVHHAVETRRGRQIPDESYKDVLYLLIHYSIAAFELLERPLDPAEKEDVVDVFVQMGRGMGLSALPARHSEWKIVYRNQQVTSLKYSCWTADLFRQYRKHLGWFRYRLLLQVQSLLAPPLVNKLLKAGPSLPARLMIGLYRVVRHVGCQRALIRWLVPRKFGKELSEMES